MPIRPENRLRYPRDWQLRRRFILTYRAGNRCEWCGARNREPNPATGSIVVLTLAHVGDRRPEAASLLNLAALCQLCHLRHDNPTRWAERRRRLEARRGQRLLFPTIEPGHDARALTPGRLP